MDKIFCFLALSKDPKRKDQHLGLWCLSLGRELLGSSVSGSPLFRQTTTLSVPFKQITAEGDPKIALGNLKLSPSSCPKLNLLT